MMRLILVAAVNTLRLELDEFLEKNCPWLQAHC